MERGDVKWDAALTGATLHNKLVSLGAITIPAQAEISPDLTYRYVLGKPLASWYSSQITSIDTIAGFATVTDAPVFSSPQFPTFTANFSSTVTFFRNFRLYGLITHQQGAKILNVTPLYQDLTGTSGGLNLPADQGGYSKAERIAHSGPFKTAAGASVPLVLDRYLQPTDFVRLQEVSLSYDLPVNLAQRARAQGASLVIGARNLHVWKKKAFDGPDPELQANTVNGGQGQFASVEEFTVPNPRRWLVRLNLAF